MKLSVGGKIILTYMVILMITFTVLGVSFYGLIRSFLIRETQEQLLNQARTMVKIIQQLRFLPGELPRASLRVVGRVLDADYAVIKSNGEVLLSSRDSYFSVGSMVTYEFLRKVFRGRVAREVLRVNQKDMILVAVPVERPAQAVAEGVLVVMAEVRGIRLLTGSIFLVLGEGLAISALVSLALAFWLGRSVSRPARELRDGARKLAARAFDTRVNVQTGDEMGELAGAFNSMAAELEAYDRSQKHFLQNASHELKTPLMAVRGYAESIKDKMVAGKELDHALNIIIAESDRVTRLVNELVYLSKLETMEELYRHEELDLNLTIRDAVGRLAGLAVQKGVAVELQPSPPVRFVGDAEKLLQAWLNLLGNAVRYASGRVLVTVEERDHRVRVSFADDGPGIAEKDLPRVFERFFKGKDGDTGLGLAISRAIIERSGGTITAKNRLDGGAVFIIELPC